MNDVPFNGLHNCYYQTHGTQVELSIVYWKCIITELSFFSSINTFTSLSTPDMIAFINLAVRLQLLTVAQSLTEAGRKKTFYVQSYCFRRLMRNLLITMQQFDWVSTVQGTHIMFVTELSLAWSSSFSLKASQLQRSQYWSLEELKGWKATTFAIPKTINIAVFYFFWKFSVIQWTPWIPWRYGTEWFSFPTYQKVFCLGCRVCC